MFIFIVVLQIASLIFNVFILHILYSPFEGVEKSGMMTPNGFIRKKEKREPVYNTDEKQYAREIGEF